MTNTTYEIRLSDEAILPAPDCLLFDMDGVLADVSASYRGCIIDTARMFGVSVSNEQIAKMKRETGSNNDWIVTRRLIAQCGVGVSLDMVTSAFQSIYHGTADRRGKKWSETALIDSGLARKWSCRMPLGIVTGRPRKEAIEFLDRFGISSAFSALVALEDAPAKPNPEGIRHITQYLGCRQPWMVGDTPDDIFAASGAGVVPIGIAPRGDLESINTLKAAGAIHVLTSVNDLEALLP